MTNKETKQDKQTTKLPVVFWIVQAVIVIMLFINFISIGNLSNEVNKIPKYYQDFNKVNSTLNDINIKMYDNFTSIEHSLSSIYRVVYH